MAETLEGGLGINMANEGNVKPEIDTSAPFESVKEAVSRFGGGGSWKPLHLPSPLSPSQNDMKEVDIVQVEEQAAELERELIVKEKDTLLVLKELEATKLIIEDLKSKIQTKESRPAPVSIGNNADDEKATVIIIDEEEKENNPNLGLPCQNSPGLILMELNRAKLNLTRTTTDLAEIRACVESYNKKIERERISLEKTRQRLISNSSKISALEKEIGETGVNLNYARELDDVKDISDELQRLNSEAEDFKKMGEVARLEVANVMSEIQETRIKTRTVEAQLVAARKMKEAAMVAEAIAVAEIKAIEASESSKVKTLKSEQVTLTLEEYASLKRKAREAEERSETRVTDVMLRVDEANLSKIDVLKRLEEATEEVKTSKKALEEVLSRVEAANEAKLAVEDALRKWRSEHSQRRRSSQSMKFKNPCPSEHRRDPKMLDLNGINLVSETQKPGSKPALSIGQILSRKLMVTEEFESGKSSRTMKRKVSLGQMLGKPRADVLSAWKLEKEFEPKKLPTKRKKLGFARISLLLTKESHKKKKKAATPR